MTSTREFTGQKYAIETLVTDTISYDVIKHTAKTITVRRRARGDNSFPDESRDKGAYGLTVMLVETVSDEFAPTHTLRLRKDGTYRQASWARALRFTDELPVDSIDYRV